MIINSLRKINEIETDLVQYESQGHYRVVGTVFDDGERYWIVEDLENMTTDHVLGCLADWSDHAITY